MPEPCRSGENLSDLDLSLIQPGESGTELQRVSPGGEKKTSTFLQRLPREQASRGLWVRGGRIVEVAGKGNGGGALEGS